MRIDDLPIPVRLRDAYLSKGIEELYPPQEACVQAGLLNGKNILAAIPTASGKTLIAETAMQKAIAGGGKCLYIVPLKALAAEKYDDFSNKGVTIGIATGDPDQRDEYLGRYDIIVATSEKVDSLIRNKAEWINRISLLVVDEIHLIGDETRGATLEMIIVKLKYLIPELQIIGLSATMGNPEELATWLGAELITSDWRPVDLREGVYYNGKIQFHAGVREVPAVKKDDDLNLLLDTIEEGGQCLVFVSSRRLAESFAKRAAAVLKRSSPALDTYAARIEKADTSVSGKTLAVAIRNGAAFHHAGLSRTVRAVVEEGFRNGDILSISSTPTLAAGLNLPARRVIIRDYMRFDAGTGMNNIPVMEYRQMAGRAGRPRLDPYGEAVLIAKSRDKVNELFEVFIDAPAETITSQCQRESQLRGHLLALIASRFTKTREEIAAFMESTLYASQKTVHRRLDRNIDKALEFLQSAGMIDIDGDELLASSFGSLSSRLYLDPETALMIKDALVTHMNDDFSIFGMLHVISMTPNMFRFYLKPSDEDLVDRILTERAEELWSEDMSEEFFKAIKSAAVIEDWIAETPEETIAERFGIGSGDVHAAVDTLKWLIHAAARISHEYAPGFEWDLKMLELRITNGIRSELIPLIKIKGIGRVRARRLYDMGITSPEKLIAADKSILNKVLGNVTAEKAILDAKRSLQYSGQPRYTESEPAHQSRTEDKEEPKKQKQPTLFDF